MQDKIYKASFDGSSRAEDERSTIGFIIYASKRKVLCRSFRPVDYSTSVEVEYIALRELLRTAKGFGIRGISIQGDCKTVIDYVNKVQPVHNPAYTTLNDECLELLTHFTHYNLKWVPRKRNYAADRLSRLSLNPKGRTKNEHYNRSSRKLEIRAAKETFSAGQ